MGIRTRLATMMALAYAVQGAFWPLLSVHLDHLNVSERERGLIFATLAMAAVVSPAIAGRLADRSISAQKLLAIIYATGAGFLILVAWSITKTFRGLFPLFLAYWLVMIPYLSLTSAIAMRNLKRPGEEFNAIRLWGTIGWMAASWMVAAAMLIGGWGTSTAFIIAAILAILMFLTCFRLPDTPPLATSSVGLPIREAKLLLGQPGVLVVLVAAFLVSLTTPFVYQSVPLYLKHIGLKPPRIAAAMSLGQVPEIFALAFLPLALHHLGRKATLSIGVAAWIFYHGIFATHPPVALALFAIPLNGVAIAFFHVTAPMYLDSQAPQDHRAGAQGLWVMTTSGIGSLVGGVLAGEVMQQNKGNWQAIFLVPTAAASLALILMLVGFRSRRDRCEGVMSSDATSERVGLPNSGLARVESPSSGLASRL